MTSIAHGLHKVMYVMYLTMRVVRYALLLYFYCIYGVKYLPALPYLGYTA